MIRNFNNQNAQLLLAVTSQLLVTTMWSFITWFLTSTKLYCISMHSQSQESREQQDHHVPLMLDYPCLQNEQYLAWMMFVMQEWKQKPMLAYFLPCILNYLNMYYVTRVYDTMGEGKAATLNCWQSPQCPHSNPFLACPTCWIILQQPSQCHFQNGNYA